MRARRLIWLSLTLLAAATSASAQSASPRAAIAPRLAHHQHLMSPALVADAASPTYPAPITAAELVRDMDDLGVQRAVIFSQAYTWGDDRRGALADEYDRVRAENDWTVAQARRFPDRLVVFCGLSPLRPYAVEETERCARLPGVRGIKLHLGNSGVDLRNPEHLTALQRVFRAANAAGLSLVLHTRTRGGQGYTPDLARIVIERLLPQAPDVTVQIAHLAGSGPGYSYDEVLAIYAEALAARDPRTRNLYLDTAGVVVDGQSAETAATVARRLRQIGMDRVLFGSDLHPNPPMLTAWAAFRRELALTDAELADIADNVAPYMRQ